MYTYMYMYTKHTTYILLIYYICNTYVLIAACGRFCDCPAALAISVGAFSTAKNPNFISVGITAKLAQL